ncbi:putative transferase [Helianthus annuus]|nr:putative transferase [Helianthus annuus]KAJ0924339.1 putative transferase [Helianthus annuus]
MSLLSVKICMNELCGAEDLIHNTAEGRISDSTVTLAVPDLDGHRIGSGAATLNAILALANYYHKSQNAVVLLWLLCGL